MDDVRLGAVARALRRRTRLRQRDVAERAGVNQSTVSRFERGDLDGLSLRATRSILAALGVRLDLEPRWRGAALERLVDEDHARLSAGVVAILRARGWHAEVEVTYSRYGERGSIDILAFHPSSAALLVVEIKTLVASVEATLRNLDAKARLAPRVASEQLGWSAARVSRVLVVADTRTNRRAVERHAALFAAALPTGSRGVRLWLREPVGTLRGLWFLSFMRRGTPKQKPASRDCVRVGRACTNAAAAVPGVGHISG